MCAGYRVWRGEGRLDARSAGLPSHREEIGTETRDLGVHLGHSKGRGLHLAYETAVMQSPEIVNEELMGLDRARMQLTNKYRHIQAKLLEYI